MRKINGIGILVILISIIVLYLIIKSVSDLFSLSTTPPSTPSPTIMPNESYFIEE